LNKDKNFALESPNLFFPRERLLVCEMISKRKKTGSMLMLLSVVLFIVIGDVAGGPTDRIERASPSQQCGETKAASGYAVGGTNTRPNSWPWMVALRRDFPENKTAFFCAGSLIAERHVVSGKDKLMALHSVCSSSFIFLRSSCPLF
jgi:hypothetical protein